MAAKALPSPEVLRQLLRYELDTGRLFWKERGVEWFASGVYPASHNCAKWNTRYAGAEAFTTVDTSGYRCGRIFDQLYQAHRIIWAIVHGREPTAEIDHANGDKLDNRPENLRESDRSGNNCNKHAQSNNKSGFKGVRYIPATQSFDAAIQHNGRRHYLGRFLTAEAAHDAYCNKAAELHGEFARTN